MNYLDAAVEPEETSAIIVKADEVDEAGADISTISPRNSSGAEFDERIESRRAQDAQARGSPKLLANAVPSPARPITRPHLRRDGSAILPPQQPPPPTPPQRDEQGNHSDSLSLMQLRKLVTDLPKLEPVAYAYEYEESRAFPEELEEWFQYTEEERRLLIEAKQTFEEKWEEVQASCHDSSTQALEWTEAEPIDRESFLVGSLQALASSEIITRVKILECISYVALGVWGETAGLDVESESINTHDNGTEALDSRYEKFKSQINWIHDGAKLLCKVGAIRGLIDILRKFCESDQESGRLLGSADNEKLTNLKLLMQAEISHSLTVLYILVEVGRQQGNREDGYPIRQAIAEVKPSLLLLLVQILAKLRWEESSVFPLSRVLLLLWKSILLLFGGSQELKESKDVLQDRPDESACEHSQDFITASPLDYHLFRQEITSKYPSYSPPLPLVPIELENNSILPPLPNHPSRRTSHEVLHPRTGSNINGGSIFNQPVHIATPAPSPPPSPAGPGGKGGKKQNYQTNQNFPFLYPPLDNTSNIMGGKGNAELQDQLVGKKWEGSDVPASILEAGQLFASRVRMSRSVRQLWDIREKFIKYERGWDASEEAGPKTEPLEGDAVDKMIGVEENTNDHAGYTKETENESVQRCLDTVEDFYRNSLPYLQSLVIVLWKVTFANVSALVSQSNVLNGMPNGFPFSEDNVDPQGKRKSNPNSAVQLNGTANAQLSDHEDNTDAIVEEINAIRSREITSKAVSGIILMLLKWFKLSHILKFEYLTQLLLDANYIPLILKLFAHQDIDRAVDQRNDREDLDIFKFCLVNSKHPPTSVPQPLPSPSPSSEEDSAPPPIRTHRRSPSSDSPPPPPSSPPPPRPEVDELGYSTTGALPSSPLTTYSPRFFFTTITLLRILQKITKRKAHRALLLVQYKSSTILRRTLKIPQPDLRLYTLKLFKSQVPYCGRKWRQTNMRVITAIYLHCKPELRDEWLCGGDVDGVVEEAVPLEQASRSLVHWWHLRAYRSVMEGVGGSAIEDEGNFFERELEKMRWGTGGGEVGGDEDEGEGVGNPVQGGSEWEGGPLQSEGWA